MPTTLAPHAAPDLASYAANLSRSHRDWLLSLQLPGETPAGRLARQPLRRLALEGDDLVLEFGAAPGRPERLRLAGPFHFEPRRTGLELELHLAGPRGARHTLRLSPPPRA